MQGIGMIFFVNESKLHIVANQSQEMLVFEWLYYLLQIKTGKNK